MKLGDEIQTNRLIIRHWNKQTDKDAFFRLNNDAQVMKFYPKRRTKDEANNLLDVIKEQLENIGYSWTAVTLKTSGEIIGFGGLAAVPESFPTGASTEIGWRFLPEHWGSGYATEAAKAYLEYGFNILNREEIISFAVHNNEKSLKVMQRIGMKSAPERDFDHPALQQREYEHLKRHRVYELTRADWSTQQ